MSEAIYRNLARHLDQLPGGYPPTENSVELRILKRLFTPEEAQLAVHLTLLPERPAVVARRAGIPVAEASERLEQMALKGLVFRLEDGPVPTYLAAQFVIGIWEFQVNRLTPELIADVNEYMPRLVTPDMWTQLRVIPVERAIDPDHQTMTYERAGDILASRKKILLAPCICRREHTMAGHGCGRLEESCLIFDDSAAFYEKNGLGRPITLEEAREVLAEAERQALVPQPSNGKDPLSLCLCCGCCCQALKAFKRHPSPEKLVAGSFRAQYNAEACVGCGKCVARCQMDAYVLREKGEPVEYDAGKCIGCGLCVTTCPTKAISLKRREEKKPLPKNVPDALMRIGKERGTLSAKSLAWMVLKSKFDRLMASKD